MKRRGLWQYPDFLKLWAGQAVSQFGTQVTYLALPLTAALLLKATPVQMGVLAAAETLPIALVGLFAGVWADRSRRRPVLIAADIGRAILLGSVPLAAAIGMLHIVQLYVVAFLVGVLSVFFGVAYAPFLLTLVHRERIVEGNSKLSMTESAANIAGPGLAGSLIQLATAPVAILADALSFLVSALFLGLIRSAEPMPPAPERRGGIRREIRDGFRVVTRDRILRAIAGCTGTWAFFDTVVLAVLVLYVTRQLRVAPGLLGLIFASGSVGFLLGNLLVERATRRFGSGPVVVGAAVVSSVGGVLVAAARGPAIVAVVVLMVAQFTLGLGAGLYFIVTAGLQQLATPDHVQGRVNASMRVLSQGVRPVGAVVGGILGAHIGLQPTLVVGAVGGVVGFLWVWFSPLRTLRDQPTPAETTGTALS